MSTEVIMKILIVDDEPTNLVVLVGILKNIARCVTAFSGKDALQEFSKSLNDADPFEMILLDIMMPEMDGHECMSKIRTIENDFKVQLGNEVKIVIVSAVSDQNNVCKSFFHGNATYYLTKPVNREELLKLVNVRPLAPLA